MRRIFRSSSRPKIAAFIQLITFLTGVSGICSDSDAKLDSEMERILVEHGDDLKQCMTRERIFGHQLSGNITLKIFLTRGGKVVDAKVLSSTVGSSRVEDCLINGIKKIEDFPSTSGSAKDRTYILPIDFPPPPAPPKNFHLRKKVPVA